VTGIRPLLAWLALAALTGAARPLAAQQDVVRLGITYRAGARPGIIVLAAPGLDSVRKILERDLDYSDRFEVAFVADSAAPLAGTLNLGLWRQYGLAWAVELRPTIGGVEAQLHDLAQDQVRLRVQRGVNPAGIGIERMGIHRLSDEIVTAITGDPGIAATRVLFINGDAVWSIDSDGATLTRVSRGTGKAMSPAWAPDGSRIAFTELRDYAGPIILQNLVSGSRQTVPGTSGGGNALTPTFSPDGRELLFAPSTEAGTDISRVDIQRMCCVTRLTVGGKLADNLNPAYSPDGRRVVFESTRSGRNQIYVMDADGANQRALVPFDGASVGPSFAPVWSPDGQRIAFHRDIAGGRQVMVYDFGSGRATALTSLGRNEDPSWAPDSRHLIFRSTRERGEQLWILDLESARSRQLTNMTGPARMPAWSPRLTGPVS
jgi:TolB protein